MKEIEISVEELIEKIKILKKIKTDKDVVPIAVIWPPQSGWHGNR